MVVGREEDGKVYCAAIILLDAQRRLQRKNAIGRGANVGAAPDRIHPDVFEHRVIRGEKQLPPARRPRRTARARAGSAGARAPGVP